MADVMAEGDRLDEILVKPERAADGPGDLGDELDMEDAVGDMIVFQEGEDLRLVDIACIGT